MSQLQIVPQDCTVGQQVTSRQKRAENGGEVAFNLLPPLFKTQFPSQMVPSELAVYLIY